MDSGVVPMYVCVVVLLLLTELEFQFELESVEYTVGIIESVECWSFVLVFLF